jgi:hypothetical protein
MRGLEKLREKVKGRVLYRNNEMGEIRKSKDKKEGKEEREETIELDNITVIGEEVAMREDKRWERKHQE